MNTLEQELEAGEILRRASYVLSAQIAAYKGMLFSPTAPEGVRDLLNDTIRDYESASTAYTAACMARDAERRQEGDA